MGTPRTHFPRKAIWYTCLFLLLFLLDGIGLAAGKVPVARTFTDGGQLVDEIVVPPSPPPKDLIIPPRRKAAGDVMLPGVPAYDWVYGCTPTAGGMGMGYYDRNGFPNMYTGPNNGGVMPLDNAVAWGSGAECPLIASHQGYDGRATRGHVDDYWGEPDPYVAGSWTAHTDDSMADFMGTSQNRFGHTNDGSTTFYYYSGGGRYYDPHATDTGSRDGCHGLRLFVESRGYSVKANFNQYVVEQGLASGFSFDEYCAEIDAGRPVLIQVTSHTMLGVGYNRTGNIVYVHTTWGNYVDSFAWGTNFGGREHYGVTVLQIGIGTPTGVTATDGTNFDCVRVTWPSVSGATHYRVFRADSAGGAKTALGSWQTTRTFDDTSTVPGVTHYYFVTAATSASGANESNYSDPDSGYRGEVGIPTNVQATDGTYPDKVRVTWTAATNALYYRVYRMNLTGGERTALGSWQSGTTYDDTSAVPGATYFYWVTGARSTSGANEGYGSGTDGGWRILPAPTGVTATDGTDTEQVVITWNAVAGANYYRVYRANTINGTKTALRVWQTGTTFSDSSVAPCQTYYYFVVASYYSDSTNPSDYGGPDSGWRSFTAPTGVAATDGTEAFRVLVTWDYVLNAQGYRVSRSNTETGAKTPVSGWQTDRLFYDTTASFGTTYYYWVQASYTADGSSASGYSAYDTGYIANCRMLPSDIPTSFSSGDNHLFGFPVLAGRWTAVGTYSYVIEERNTLLYTFTNYAQAANFWGSYTNSNYVWPYRNLVAANGRAYGTTTHFAHVYDNNPPTPVMIEAEVATPLTVGTPQNGALTTAEVLDAYQATLVAGEKYTLTINVTGGGNLFDVFIYKGSQDYGNRDQTFASIYGWAGPYTFTATESGGYGFMLLNRITNSSTYTITLTRQSLAPPTSLTASDGTDNDCVTVSWSAVSGASLYRVYRADSEGGTKTMLTDWQAGTTINDTTAVPGVTYYYFATAGDNNGNQESDFSAYDIGYRAVTTPVVDVGADTSINEGGTFTRAGSFTDAGTGSWTATVNYGDGSGDQALALNADKSFSFSHAYPASGTYTITVTVTDDYGFSGTDELTLTVQNVAPVVDAGPNVDLDGTGVFTGTGSFTDPGADTWTATVDYGDGSGTKPLALNPNKTFSLSHTYAGRGSYTVTVTVTDSDGGSGNDTRTVGVDNRTPVAVPEQYATDEDTKLSIPAPGVLGNDADGDGDMLTPVLAQNVAHGQLALAPDGAFSYQPDADWFGTDTFAYRASDGTASSNLVTVTITVAAVNDTPVADSQTLSTQEDTPKAVTLTATDVPNEGQTLTYRVVTPPAHGQLSGTAPNLVYTPDANWNSADGRGADTFTFVANDGIVDSSPAVVTVTVTAVNDVPVGEEQSLTTDEDVPVRVTLRALPAPYEVETLIWKIVTPPAHGRLTGVLPNLTYCPAAGYYGLDSFTFRVFDGQVWSAPARITLTVNMVNHPPMAGPLTIDAVAGCPRAVNALAVVTDADGDALAMTDVSQGTHGTVTLIDGAVTYLADADYVGTDQFTVTVQDVWGAAVLVPVTVQVYRPLSTVILSAVPGAIQPVGTPITVSAMAAGGARLEYRFTAGYVLDGVWHWPYVRSWGAASSWEWTPTVPGTYTVTVMARDLVSGQVKSAIMSYLVRGTLSAVSLTIGPSTTAPANSLLTLAATPTGGTDVRYRFWVTWTDAAGRYTEELQAYSAARTCDWRPGAPGTYTVVVWAREATSRAGVEVYTSRMVKITGP